MREYETVTIPRRYVTWEVVGLLRSRAEHEEEAHAYMGHRYTSPLRDLADCIEAALPPEDT